VNGFIHVRISFIFQWHERHVPVLLHVRLNAVSMRAVLATALAVCLIPIGTARADLRSSVRAPAKSTRRPWSGFATRAVVR
jgi:hypothetical protein